jgi:hypothetical protein
MAISTKPKTQPTPAPDVDVEALIAKGGSIAKSESPEEETATSVTSFTLRVPNDILKPLDAHRKKQSYKVPRQQWILEAIIQRLEREGASPNS